MQYPQLVQLAQEVQTTDATIVTLEELRETLYTTLIQPLDEAITAKRQQIERRAAEAQK